MGRTKKRIKEMRAIADSPFGHSKIAQFSVGKKL
jgi:hypothetical protein